MGRSRAR
jgi:F-type H+-transporting ATPase subunit b